MSRNLLLNHFIKKIHWDDAKQSFIQKDCSFRNYLRLTKNTPFGVKTALIMDAPPPYESLSSFIHMQQHLSAQGLSTPFIYEKDEENGFLLLEDLGEKNYAQILPLTVKKNQISDEERLYYHEATNLLLHLHQSSLPAFSLPLLDKAFLHRELTVGIEWYIEKLLGIFLSDDVKSTFYRAWDDNFNKMCEGPSVCTLRDFHSPNLLWLSKRQGIKRVGIIDFQDAVIGPRAYDVMSLLVGDPRREVADILQEEMLAYYTGHVLLEERNAFLYAYRLWAIQRNIKICGIFARQHLLHHNSSYLSFIPNARKQLIAHLHFFPELERWWHDLFLPHYEEYF